MIIITIPAERNLVGTFNLLEEKEFMAKSQLQFKRTTTDKIQVKGILSEDGTTVTYEDDNKVEQEIKVSDLLNAFVNQPIDLSVSLKSEEDLDVIPADNE